MKLQLQSYRKVSYWEWLKLQYIRPCKRCTLNSKVGRLCWSRSKSGYRDGESSHWTCPEHNLCNCKLSSALASYSRNSAYTDVEKLLHSSPHFMKLPCLRFWHVFLSTLTVLVNLVHRNISYTSTVIRVIFIICQSSLCPTFRHSLNTSLEVCRRVSTWENTGLNKSHRYS